MEKRKRTQERKKGKGKKAIKPKVILVGAFMTNIMDHSD